MLGAFKTVYEAGSPLYRGGQSLLKRPRAAEDFVSLLSTLLFLLKAPLVLHVIWVVVTSLTTTEVSRDLRKSDS